MKHGIRTAAGCGERGGAGVGVRESPDNEGVVYFNPGFSDSRQQARSLIAINCLLQDAGGAEAPESELHEAVNTMRFALAIAM